jgi:hypothetical protein
MRLAPSAAVPVSAGWVRHLSVSLRVTRGAPRGHRPAALVAVS